METTKLLKQGVRDGRTAAEDSAEADLLKSGMSMPRQAAARAGYVPVPLERVLIEALKSIPVYLQTSIRAGKQFTLYCAANGRFTEGHRQRLYGGGVKFVFIPMSHHSLLQAQMECELESMAADPVLAMNTKSAIVYETSLELINEVLAEQGVGKSMPRLEKVSRAVSTLVVKNAEAFPHLFATAQHDFYTATHMVNVGTWMTSLAYALGERDPAMLGSICTAGMLHDVGKLQVPESVLNKKSSLTEEEWRILRRHPVSGYEYLKAQGVRDEVVLRVALEHHERMDGSGYPNRLKGEELHPASKICAAVDSFDSMTAFRPYKNEVRSLVEALGMLRQETPEKYDGKIVDIWAELMSSVPRTTKARVPSAAAAVDNDVIQYGRRAYERFGIDCPVDVHMLTLGPTGWQQGPASIAKAHNISRGGLGMLIRKELKVGGYLRIFLRGRGTLANRLLEGKAVRCRNYGDGWHEVGLKFCVPGAQESASAAMVAGWGARGAQGT